MKLNMLFFTIIIRNNKISRAAADHLDYIKERHEEKLDTAMRITNVM
ncbi:YrzI family small protein [Peribacillus kribbensis]|nr:YrzI family small protein [Peribacillus kribbensis]